MSAIITEKFRQHNATQFHESFSESSGNTYYLTIGKSSPFTSATSGGADDSPPTPADDVTSEFYTWDSAIASKKIASTNITFAIPRRDYSSTSKFDMYEHDVSSSNTTTSGATNLFDSTFSFKTDDNRVYKVLDNFGGSQAIGGSKPTFSGIDTVGNYKCMFMYTITASEQQAFMTSDFMPVSTDSTVSTAAVDGALDTVKIVTAGEGGTDGTHTNIDIHGDGTGGKVSVTISSGAITAVNVTTAGTGYTFGTINEADINTAGGGSLSSSSLKVIIPPKGGHGSNAVEELGGHYVMMQASIEGADGDDFLTQNDFREISLIVDPTTFGTSTVASATTARNVYAVKLESGAGTFTVDEKITQATTTAVGKVVAYDSTLRILYYVQERFADHGTGGTNTGGYVAFSTTATITGASSGATGTPDAAADSAVTLAGGNTITFTDGYANPELQPDSGNIIYRETRKPISRATDQTEDIKVIVEF